MEDGEIIDMQNKSSVLASHGSAGPVLSITQQFLYSSCCREGGSGKMSGD